MEHSTLAGWQTCEPLPLAEFQALKRAGIDPIQAQLLANRGLRTPEAIQAFIAARYDQTPDPLALNDMPLAVTRIRQALDSGEHITVYGDYDADGVTSSVLLTRALRLLKQPTAPLDYYIPDRIQEGCGLNLAALDLLKARGTSLLITTDCASSDVEQVDYAQNSLGIDVIITDHHRPPEPRPQAFALINPWRSDSSYPERVLCGAGTAFKLVQALYRSYQRPVEDELDLLDLLAVGTIADVAELLGENHTLVRLGLERLNRSTKPGLRALLRNAGLHPGKIRERDIAFSLAPRINAAGRMEHARIAFELLATDSHEEAIAYAEQVERLNQARQVRTEEIMTLARMEANLHPADPILLVSGKDWPEGIIGLVAGKLAEELQRPALVLSEGETFSRGSARSRLGFNMINALRSCADLLERHGGHAQAAGFTVANSNVATLHQRLLRWQESGGTAVDPSSETSETELDGATAAPEHAAPPSSQQVDLTLTRAESFNYNTYTRIRQLGPFGAANPEPTFRATGLRLVYSKTSGAEGRNLRLRLSVGHTQIMGTMVRGAAHLAELQGVTHVSAIFRFEPAWHPTNGESSQEISLKILAIEPVHATANASPQPEP